MFFMSKNMTPFVVAVEEKYTIFLSKQDKFIENIKIPEGILKNSTNNNLDPFDYHLAKYGGSAFERMECNQIRGFYPIEKAEEDDDEEGIWKDQRELDGWNGEQMIFDKPAYWNGNNEMVKILNQKCVTCFGNLSVYAFRQFGHRYICEICYENKVDKQIIKCIICRT